MPPPRPSDRPPRGMLRTACWSLEAAPLLNSPSPSQQVACWLASVGGKGRIWLSLLHGCPSESNQRVNVNVNELRLGFSNTTKNPEGILSYWERGEGRGWRACSMRVAPQSPASTSPGSKPKEPTPFLYSSVDALTRQAPYGYILWFHLQHFLPRPDVVCGLASCFHLLALKSRACQWRGLRLSALDD